MTDSQRETPPQRYGARATVIGEDTRILRALPHRERRTVGAWCFLDHLGPVQFAPGKGMHVGAHPHIGLQTFTWMIGGGVVHRDSLGNEQTIRPGQVNLMTAGRGLAHTEDSLLEGARLHAAHLWFALPDAQRHCAPAFENYRALARHRPAGGADHQFRRLARPRARRQRPGPDGAGPGLHAAGGPGHGQHRPGPDPTASATRV